MTNKQERGPVVWLVVVAAFIGIGLIGSFSTYPKGPEKASDTSGESDIGKQLAKDLATGEVILMAACLAKEGGIPRNKMGDYIAAAVADQGITKADLFDNWDSKYWPLAKEAEKRSRTSCLN
jgi:hypothetical protein